MPAVSLRLAAILDVLHPCRVLADIGTDHGLVPVHAVLQGIAQAALACDLREEPLRVASKNVQRHGVDGRVRLIQGNGLLSLEGEQVDAVVIAGMSGNLMERICSEAPHVLQSVSQLVMQPNINAYVVRAWAHGAGFHLKREVMVEEHNRLFVVCAFQRQPGPDPAYGCNAMALESLFKLGPLLLRDRSLVALKYYQEQCRRLRGFTAFGDSGESHLAELAMFEKASELLSNWRGERWA